MSEWEVCEAMIRYGGHFVHQLGRLYRAADTTNQARLREAFSDLWMQYEALAQAPPTRSAGGPR